MRCARAREWRIHRTAWMACTCCAAGSKIGNGFWPRGTGCTTISAIKRKVDCVARAYLSLGSNVDPERHLTQALAELDAKFGAVAASRFIRTPAVGFDGPDFLNAAAIVETDLGIVELDAWLHALEDAHGRR